MLAVRLARIGPETGSRVTNAVFTRVACGNFLGPPIRCSTTRQPPEVRFSACVDLTNQMYRMPVRVHMRAGVPSCLSTLASCTPWTITSQYI